MAAKYAKVSGDGAPPVVKRRISRLHDARAVRSRAALRNALLELIDTREFSQITIKEIAEQAGLSYPVFFRQFASTDELLADVATEQVRKLLEHTNEAFDPNGKAQLKEVCEYVERHRKLWTSLLTTGASSSMRKEFSRISEEIATSRPRSNPALPTDLVTELVTNAIFDILTWWLRQPEDYPTGNIVKLLDALIVQTYQRPVPIELD